MNLDSPNRAPSKATVGPQPVTLASGLLALVIVGNIVGPLLPSSEGEIGFGVVAALIASVAAWGLWSLRRWGLVMTIVVATQNMLLDAPGVVVGSTGALKVWAGLTVLVSGAVVFLVTRPEARGAYRPPTRVSPA